MKFNIFHYSGDEEAFARAIAPISCPVKIWSPSLPINYTWVQQFRLMAHDALLNNEPWFGYAHDDGEMTKEDFQKLLDARQNVDYEQVMAIMTRNPTDPQNNTDVYCLFNTQLYWKVGGHDENFTLYWADTDFFLRYTAAGYRQEFVSVDSLKHAQSYCNKKSEGLQKTARDLHFIKDRAYFYNKHPNHAPL